MSWGMTFDQVAKRVQAGFSRVYARMDGRHSSPSLGVVLTHSRRNVQVKIGGKVHIVAYDDLKPCDRHHGHETPPQPEEPYIMPPEKAPRPTPAQMAMSGAPTAIVQAAAVDIPAASSNIVVIAARMDEMAKKVRASRVQLSSIESDLKAITALHDEERAKVQKCQEEYDALLRQLNDASRLLVSV